jgi:2-polyprenyl-3-methyl-5-hydroxy-6-metoxy-1,4-benzoquinol methylase
MKIELQYPDGLVTIEERGDGLREVVVRPFEEGYMTHDSCRTKYSAALIKKIIDVVGIRWVCHEIMREESPIYVERYLFYSLFSYMDENTQEADRILDFGCGCGASTIILKRMFPSSSIIGIDLEKKYIDIAHERASFYGIKQDMFILSPSGKQLPAGVGKFDLIVMSAVYEHLLPEERKPILINLWAALNPGGILFINQTPDRRFPFEVHTTFLPLVNYFSDRLTLECARRFSKMIEKTESWQSLLRAGIRGATPKEILSILESPKKPCGAPLLLKPKRIGIRNQSEIYFTAARERLCQRFDGNFRRFIFLAIDLIKLLRFPLAPYLSLAIQKPIPD